MSFDLVPYGFTQVPDTDPDLSINIPEGTAAKGCITKWECAEMTVFQYDINFHVRRKKTPRVSYSLSYADFEKFLKRRDNTYIPDTTNEFTHTNGQNGPGDVMETLLTRLRPITK